MPAPHSHLARQPVIAGFHPDPSICRVADTYYLVTSSFEYGPGVPIFQSTDLRSWTQIGNVLTRASQLSLQEVEPSGGTFAPTLRHHAGRFWMITTNVSDGLHHLLVTAETPSGPWSEPVRIEAAAGIDPDLAWDEAGTCYLTWSAFGRIVQAELDPVTGALLTEPRPLWQGTGGQFPEGPHIYHVNGLWYLLIAEGGTGQGHAVTIARGPTPSGPFESCPHNPVLTARGAPTQVQSTGHADLVLCPDGSWAMVHLGIRQRGGFPGWHVMGRETFAVEIGWKDDWPHVIGPIEPDAGVSVGASSESFGVDEAALPSTWVRPGGFPEEVLRNDDGWRLSASSPGPPASPDDVFVGRRQQHWLSRLRAVVTVPPGTVGGISARIDPWHHLSLEVEGDEIRAVLAIGPTRSILARCSISAGESVALELRTEHAQGELYSPRRGPDRIVAAVVRDGESLELAEIDGRYVSTELAGGFTGRLLGLWCARGELLITSVRYEGSLEAESRP